MQRKRCRRKIRAETLLWRNRYPWRIRSESWRVVKCQWPLDDLRRRDRPGRETNDRGWAGLRRVRRIILTALTRHLSKGRLGGSRCGCNHAEPCKSDWVHRLLRPFNITNPFELQAFTKELSSRPWCLSRLQSANRNLQLEVRLGS